MNYNLKTSLLFLLTKYKRIILPIIAVLIVFISYRLLNSSTWPQQDQKVVEVETVKYDNIKQTVDFIGTIRSKQQTLLTAKSQGILVTYSKPGQFHKKGDLIAEIDNKNIEKNYKILRKSEQIAKTQFDRANALLKSKFANKNFVEEKKSSWLDIQKKLSDAKISSDEYKIYAPFDGVIGLFKIREGAQVFSGDPIVNFYDPNSLLVEFDLPLSVAEEVNDGAQVFLNNQEYKLTHVQKILDEETHMCPAYVEINCPNCIIGTSTDVTITIDSKSSVIVIPYEAVFLKRSKPFVYIVQDNKAILTRVELGIREKDLIEIDSGLNRPLSKLN